MADVATSLRRRGGRGDEGSTFGATQTESSRFPASSDSTNDAASSSTSLWQWIFGPPTPDTPESMAASLQSSLRREYGDHCPDFVQLSFRDTTNLAKADGKFLLVYLHSEVHQDTPSFCKNALCTDDMQAFVAGHDNVLFWAGSVLQPEGYSVSLSLGAASFPFLCLVLSTPRGINIVDKVQGNIPKTALVSRLTAAVQRNQQQLATARAQELFRTEAQLLREQQDLEYQQSLEADRRKAEEEALRKAKEEEEAREESLRLHAQAEAARTAAAEREAAVELKRSRLTNGPATKGKDTAFIRLQLHNGTKLERLFWATDTFQTVRDFVDVAFFEREIAIVRYELATNFPRKSWDADHSHVTLQDAGLAPQALLYVQDLDS
ncbi:hypothetical protein H310_02381 [Aphanomyces invadans]|uniref:UBX domain-containing protein n=1 Tax=Aphanomyces invadans TaxID=157072 RepID=A0A024UP99_9STRA|nr:hypothetical protein H310_02381 [Aphanomyces invadans]ETW08000.1 hypothetical protein H310_02381 [Aphanomyces invadans]|eukprot:XP_008864093.1 hypothetical protein H310_02381 [Aphanomyces invadans]